MKLNVEKLITKAEQEVITKELAAGTKNKAEAIRALFAGGLDVKDIASVTGIKYNHVYNVIKNEVLVHNLEVETVDRSVDSKRAKIIALLKEGKTITAAAQTTNCLYNYAWKVAKENGFVKESKVG